MKRWGQIILNDQWLPLTTSVGAIVWIFFFLGSGFKVPLYLTATCLIILFFRLLRAYCILRFNTVCLGVLQPINQRTHFGLAEHRLSYSYEGVAYDTLMSYTLDAIPENNLVTLYVHPKNPMQYVVYKIEDVKDAV